MDRRQDLRQPGVNLGLGVGFGLARSGNFAVRAEVLSEEGAGDLEEEPGIVRLGG